jgi:hypothetical protein
LRKIADVLSCYIADRATGDQARKCLVQLEIVDGCRS